MACIDLQWIVIQGKPVIIHAISTALISKFGLIDILDLYAKTSALFSVTSSSAWMKRQHCEAEHRTG
jgi:2C-methyl-D-erythritol 2,4-cyclodiphosphate synthase